jgi:hypothetical protein
LDYQTFCRLLEDGETQSCIFLEECMAFNGSLKDDAELAKHIIALANNESQTNYIIIGVSKDGKYKSVENSNLTDQNLQDFCRVNIAPVPVVKLEQNTWPESNDNNHRDKLFLFIQVTAQERTCFRFNQQFHDSKQYCDVKEGEVWIRHGTDTEFASPEKIKKLFEKKLIDKAFYNINFSILHYASALSYILQEIQQLANNTGGELYSDPDPFIVRGGPALYHHVVIPFNGKPLLLRIVPFDQCIEKGQISAYHNIYQNFEHGLLLISLGDISESAVENAPYKLKETWGWFCAHEYRHAGLKERNLEMPLPKKVKLEIGIPYSVCFALTNIETNEILRQSWAKMLASLENNKELNDIIEINRHKVNIVNAAYLADGCPQYTNKKFRPKTILANEIWDPQNYGPILLNRQPEIYKALHGLLATLNI